MRAQGLVTGVSINQGGSLNGITGTIRFDPLILAQTPLSEPGRT
jgi:hypothetical protein